MKRVVMTPRSNWPARCEEIGFHFHSVDDKGGIQPPNIYQPIYWKETVAYEFTAQQIDTLEDATVDVHKMCVDAAGDIIKSGDYDKLAIYDPHVCAAIEASWRRQDPHLYGRFDVSWDGKGHPKILEYNADTPTSLIEASLAQWFWLQDVLPHMDQYNSLHEKLVARWQYLQTIWRAQGKEAHRITFAGFLECQEDVGNLEYLMETAVQAGMYTSICDMSELGHVELANGGAKLVDDRGRDLSLCFKLYPWEYMALEDENRVHIHRYDTQWIEPMWKLLLSNKALWVHLWEKHHGHPNLLATYFAPDKLGPAYVKKPIFSREGANITITDDAAFPQVQTDGNYGQEGYIYQEKAMLPVFDGMHTVLGAWIVGDEGAGLGIREDFTAITNNTSFFIPHYMTN